MLGFLEQSSNSGYPMFICFSNSHVVLRAFRSTSCHVFLSKEHKCTLGKCLYLWQIRKQTTSYRSKGSCKWWDIRIIFSIFTKLFSIYLFACLLVFTSRPQFLFPPLLPVPLPPTLFPRPTPLFSFPQNKTRTTNKQIKTKQSSPTKEIN